MGLTDLGMIMGGLALLLAGAELLVRGASRLAAMAGLSPLVIGLTVVAYGTGAPEMAVSLQAAYTGNSDIAVANVVGSNIFNVLFILGMCAAILPLKVQRQLVRMDVPIMIGASALLLLMARDGRVGPLSGALLLAGLAAYTGWSVWAGRREGNGGGPSVADAGRGRIRGMIIATLTAAAGLVLLVVGSRGLVAGAVALARLWGVSDLVIGLTIIAAGTSLPEVATSVLAAWRGARDIAIGNAIGSNIFNILGIVGISALVSPGALTVAPSLLNFDMVVMVAVAVACLPVCFTGYSIARWEGWLFMGSYGAYTAYLLLRAAEHDALPVFSQTMATFVLPLLALTVLAIAVQKRSGS
ncbi:MAG: calcium/sodium antiporter [Desulfobacterales bacterium]|jgi:cation:H+ antiporter|nr:calcium/sodium antiporter [Desulfobacterales bacterium]